ncbi:MAG TPA: restriction endonuclease subunit S [Candidatus Thermoplasmatota archaeon]|nr:restriction endonuclease subunit S [Candidatus Thermoplasmatota archaeon]
MPLLSEVCEAIVDCEHKTAPTAPEGFPSIRTTDIKRGRLDLFRANKVDAETYRAWSRRLEPRPRDIILAREAPVGEVGIIPEGARVCLGQRTVLIRPDTRSVDPHYLLYLLMSDAVRHEMLVKSNGATVAHLNLRDIRALRLPDLPPIREQTQVARTLAVLDERVSVAEEMNRTLEAMARALFKSWFVDFDPVRAKMEGRPTGLPPEVDALFPDRLVDSPIGVVPAGWLVGVLEDLLVLQRGFDLPATARIQGTVPILSAGGRTGTHNEARVRGPGVVTGRSGQLGKVFLVQEDFWPLNTTLWVKEFKASRPHHAFHVLSGIDFNVFNSGSAVPTLNRNHVHNLPQIVPPVKVVETFESAVGPFYERVRHNERETQTLSEMRDLLLGKLLSGEVRVSPEQAAEV